MGVLKSNGKLLIFASLISPSFNTVFHHQIKHLEIRQKYSAARHIFNSLLGFSFGDETLRLMLDILGQKTNKKLDMKSAMKLGKISAM